MAVETRERAARVCLLLEIPAVVIAVRFLLEHGYERATLMGQLLDTVLVLASVASVVLFSASLFLVFWGKEIWTPLSVLVVASSVLVFAILFALSTSRVPPGDIVVLGLAAGLMSLVAIPILVTSWPPGRPVPLPGPRKAVATSVLGLVSIAGVQAWNTLEFTPSRQEPSLTGSADLSATTPSAGGTRVSGTVTVKNNSDVPAVLVASQYLVWSLDVADVTDWPLEMATALRPEELADNGAGARTVIGTGMPFRPYERIGGKSEAQFRFSLLTSRTDPAFRITVRLFSARADRLFVEEPLSLAPGVHRWQDERGSQLVKTVREGSRLRAFVRRPVVAVATWWHTVSDAGDVSVPNVHVAFFDEDDRAGSRTDVNEKALREYALARLFPEVTVLAAPEKGTPSTAGSPGQ